MQTIGLPEIDAIKVILNDGTETIISKQDSWIIEKFPRWSYSKTFKYVVCHRSIKTEYSILSEDISLHRLVAGATHVKLEVDHINRNKLDNTRENLRLATRSQNIANRPPKKGNPSGVKGATLLRGAPRKKYSVCITKHGTTLNVGRFEQKDHAAFYSDINNMIYMGSFAYLNIETNRRLYKEILEFFNVPGSNHFSVIGDSCYIVCDNDKSNKRLVYNSYEDLILFKNKAHEDNKAGRVK